MKKIKTRLQFTKTTVRVLQAAELAAVQGGAAAGRNSSDNPTACFAGGHHGRGASSDNPTACVAGAYYGRGASSDNPTACVATA